MRKVFRALFNFIKPLLCENGGGMSLGRIGLWLTLSPAIKLWWTGADIKEHHLYVLGFFLCYNMYKKLPMIIDPFIKLIQAWGGVKASSD